MKKIMTALMIALVTPAFADVTGTESRVDTIADGIDTTFDFTFQAVNPAHVEIWVDADGAGPLPFVKQESGYTVALTPAQVVTFTIAPADGAIVRIQRATPKKQETILPTYGPYKAKTVERMVDNPVRQIQEVDRRVADAEATHTADKNAAAAQRTADLSTQAARDAGQDDQINASRGTNGYTSVADTSTVLATGGNAARKLADWMADVASSTSRLTSVPSCPSGTSLTYNGADFACVPPASVLRVAFTKPGCYPTGSLLGSFGERVTFARAGTKACAGVGTCQTDELCVDGSGYSLGTGEVLTVPWPSAVTANAPFCVALTADATNWATFQALLGAGAEGAANTFTSWVTGATLVSRIHDSAAVYNNLEVAQAFAAGSAHRITLCRTGSTLTTMLDGAPISGTATGAGTGNRSAAPSPIYLGSLNQSYKLTGHIREIALCRGTDAYSCATARSVNPMHVAALGDSITAGTYCGLTTTYPQALQTSLGAGWTVTNLGVSGETSAQILTRWGSQVKPNDYGRVVVMGGVNDAAGATTAAQTFANLKQIYDEARLEGLVVVPVTIWPANYYTSDQRAKIASVNASILSYCAFNGIRCVDTASLVDGDGFLLAGNTCDGLHLNQTGSNALAALVDAVVP